MIMTSLVIPREAFSLRDRIDIPAAKRISPLMMKPGRGKTGKRRTRSKNAVVPIHAMAAAMKTGRDMPLTPYRTMISPFTRFIGDLNAREYTVGDFVPLIP
jgi:hypothetical protein